MPKLLLVDDDRGLLDALQTLFTLEGYQVAAAESGREALDILLESEDETPDLIVSDVIMPHMDGRELYAIVRRNPAFARVPFLFLSATVVSEEEEESIAQLQTVRFLRKPFVVEDLCALVAEMCHLR